MDIVNNSPAIVVGNTDDIALMEEMERLAQEAMNEEGDEQRLQSSLASHISHIFQENKDARTTSGIETKMLQSLRAYNGHYDPEDIAQIKAQGGSDIYMNLTPTKCRAAMSWIRDILLPAKENAWEFDASPIPDLPKEIKDKVQKEIDKLLQPSPEDGPRAGAVGSAEGGVPGQGQPPTAPQRQPQPVADAASKIQETNQLRLDIEEAFLNEIRKIARAEVKGFEYQISDQLAEGKWDSALSEFIEDFCVFQVAVLKGPVITKVPRLKWEGGKPIKTDDFVFLNKRVSPLDIYPSATSQGINDGNLCEHIRLHRKELYDLIGVKGYKNEEIRALLQSSEDMGVTGLNTYVEDEKTVEEYRGDTYRANKGVFHGIHYFGTASLEHIKEWGFPSEDLGDDPDRQFEIEAILVGSHVIKCVINSDPLLRRPYYKASFQNIPGSWWGRSLPELMRDIQRMCNATARALSNNMGVASGPQIEVYSDRLAADEELEDIYPLKLWQVTSDPTGAGGRAINFWQPQSNAGELLSVYEKFEVMADDATGIPRYAYGNERTGGAAQTASGLSMLLESASKGIKDAIRHIDDGLIKPRLEYQFYWNMISDPDLKFSGDIVVIAKGSAALTMKGAQEMRRNEFLQVVSNPTMLEIVGMEGIAEILREMAKSLGFTKEIVPSRIELKRRKEENEKKQAQVQEQERQAAQQEQATGVKQVQMQVEQAEMASQRNAQIKQLELQMKDQHEQVNQNMKAMELQLRREMDANKNIAKLQESDKVLAQKDRDTNKNIALSIESNFQDKNNQE